MYIYTYIYIGMYMYMYMYIPAPFLHSDYCSKNLYRIIVENGLYVRYEYVET